MKSILVLFSILITSICWGQADPSLAGGSSLPPALRKANITKVEKAPKPKATASSLSSKSRVPASVTAEEVKAEQKAEAPGVAQDQDSDELSKLLEPSGSFKDKFQTWVGNNPDYIHKYKEAVHPDDIRQNRIELDIAPMFFTNSSKSTYSVRDYTSQSPATRLGASFWLTPFFGINARTMFSSGASISAGAKEALLAKHDWFDLSVNFRKFYGLSRRANSTEFGIDFSDYRLRLPTDNSTRLSLRSTGLGLHFNVRIPVAPSYSHILGVKYFPKIDLKEENGTASIATGKSAETNKISMLLGGEIKMSRESQFIWDLRLAWENSLYSGKSEAVDPATGDFASNSSVLNSFSMFSFGYRWGN